MTQRQGAQKMLPKEEPEAGFGAPLVAQRATTKVFLLDTCYLRRLIESDYGVYESLKRLSAHGDVIITGQVMRELERQMKFEKPRDEAAKILGEFHRAFGEMVVQRENVDVATEEINALSAKMAQASEKGNGRVGEGEASIFKVAGILRGLYDSIHVLSQDSDVSVLKRALGFGEMQVAAEHAL